MLAERQLVGLCAQLRLLGLELRRQLVVESSGLRLSDGGIQLLLPGIQLRLAVGQLLLLGGAVGRDVERVHGAAHSVEAGDVFEQRADRGLLVGA